MSALDEARSFFEGTTERPLDHVEALAWDLLEQLQAVRRDYETAELGCQQLEGINRELQEQLETEREHSLIFERDSQRLSDGIRAVIEMGLDNPNALETLHTTLRGSNPASKPVEFVEADVCQCDGADVLFDRSICACGVMHYFCAECGLQTDPCVSSPARES